MACGRRARAARRRRRSGRAGRRRAPAGPAGSGRGAGSRPGVGASTMAGRTPADHAGQADRVRGLLLEVGVAVELDELQRTRRAARAPAWHSSQSLLRRAVGGRLAARADDQVRPARPARVSQRDDAAAAELDVVGMRAEGQQRRRLRRGCRRRLHRSGRWCRGRHR